MFSLTITLSAAALESIKASLTHSMSEVTSSHRCEAAARGLGFRTYASLRACVHGDACPDVFVDGEAFISYLKDHGFPDATAPTFYIACARVAVRASMAKESKLTYIGIGVGERERNAGRLEAPEEYRRRFVEQRNALDNDYCAREFLRALAFLSKVGRTKNFGSPYGSYNLKHIAERAAASYPTGEVLGPHYVSNGALIAAAIHAGFKWRTYKSQSGADFINVDLNVSAKSVRALDVEIRGRAA